MGNESSEQPIIDSSRNELTGHNVSILEPLGVPNFITKELQEEILFNLYSRAYLEALKLLGVSDEDWREKSMEVDGLRRGGVENIEENARIAFEAAIMGGRKPKLINKLKLRRFDEEPHLSLTQLAALGSLAKDYDKSTTLDIHGIDYEKVKKIIDGNRILKDFVKKHPENFSYPVSK